MPELILNGCAPIPLAHYLKALGILRLLAEQRDADIVGYWRNDRLHLRTTAICQDLIEFFSHDYRPTPVLAPWNGGSGFYPKDNDKALRAVGASQAERFAAYREALNVARQELEALALTAKPEGYIKAQLLQRCRNSFPEAAVAWLDAVLVIGRDGAKFPPLLGTGGNDGRLEFTNNFMQRLIEVIDPASGKPTAECGRWLEAALFGTPAPGLATKGPVGQFFPGAAGGANATSGFDASSAVNPWDFILMIEGTLLFGAATVKRLESSEDGAFVYPFCVRQTGAGYASAAQADEVDARCEMWMPLWSQPATLAELRAIFSEGRAQVRGRPVRTGVDFAQAAVTLGVDRGITAFQRFGFQVRNGLSYFATPLDRIVVRRNGRADLLADIEHWYERLRQRAAPKANPAPPASVARALNHLERRLLDTCRDDSPGSLQLLLAALGRMECTLARSLRWTIEAHLQPLHGLRPDWILQADDGSVEFRLAQSLASTRARLETETLWFRRHLEPVAVFSNGERSWVKWAENPGNDVAWHEGELTGVLNAVLARRLVRVEHSNAKGWPDWSPRPANLTDITAFIERRTNDDLLADLIWGLSLVDWERVVHDESWERGTAASLGGFAQDEGRADELDAASIPSAFYALIRLCFRRVKGSDGDEPIPLDVRILRRAAEGDGNSASALAVRRLRGCGKAPLVTSLPVREEIARRTAAAILFPITSKDFRLLERGTLKQTHQVST